MTNLLRGWLAVPACLIALGLSPASATSIPVAWTGADVFHPQADLALTPFVADRFVGATGSATYGEMPGVSQQAVLQLHLDGVWTTVAQTPFVSYSQPTLSLATEWLPASFTAGTVDAIRIIALDVFGGQAFDTESVTCEFFNGCFQNMSTLVLTFDRSAPVPEPASMLVFGTGLLAVLGLGRGRRRR